MLIEFIAGDPWVQAVFLIVVGALGFALLITRYARSENAANRIEKGEERKNNIYMIEQKKGVNS